MAGTTLKSLVENENQSQVTTQRATLKSLILNENWRQVVTQLASNPEDAQSLDDDGCMPIHYACLNTETPLTALETLIVAYPKALRQTSKLEGQLPLHYAVVYGNPETMINLVTLLLNHYKDGATIKDNIGFTPLIYHICYEPASLNVTKILVEAFPEAVQMCNVGLYYPLHCAVKSGNWELCNYLIELYPDALRTHEGNAPRDLRNLLQRIQLQDKLRKEEESRSAPKTSASLTVYAMNMQGDKHNDDREPASIQVESSEFDKDGVLSTGETLSERNIRSDTKQSKRKQCSSVISTTSTTDIPMKSQKPIPETSTPSFTYPQQDPMCYFQQQLEEMEDFWDVTPLGNKGYMHRIGVVENILFGKVQKSGLRSRLESLIYVNGTDGCTWKKWIDRIESLLVNESCQGTIINRIEVLEKVMEGNIGTGSLHDRILALQTFNDRNFPLN